MTNFAAWYRREDYERIWQLMEDGEEFPPDFDEWEKTAKKQLADLKRQGITIEPVILAPDDFIAFCEEEELPHNKFARSKFAVVRSAGIPGKSEQN